VRPMYIALAAASLAATGCGSPTSTPSQPERKVTWDEYQKMDAEQRDDPYVLDHLADDARKRLASPRKPKR
jgi:hypothetical protein